MNRLTFNANLQTLGDNEKFLRTLAAWKPQTVVLMNSISTEPTSMFQRVKALMATWGGIVIYRRYEDGDQHLWTKYSAPGYLDALLKDSGGQKDIWYYCLNEPYHGSDNRQNLINFVSQVIEEAVKRDMRLCVGNFAIASMSVGRDDVRVWDDMLRALGKHAGLRIGNHAQIIVGTHEYTHALLPWGAAGRNPNDLTDAAKVSRDKWPTPAEVRDTPGDNWHIYRTEWFLDRVRELTGKTPDVVITECFHDRMPNIETQFRDAVAGIDNLAGRRVKGVPTLIEYWRKVFPQWTPEKALCEQYKWAEELYPANYRGFAIFSWTHHNQAPDFWRDTCDVSSFDAFLSMWPAYGSQIETPPPPDNEAPESTRQAIVLIGRNTVNIRSKPSLTGDLLGMVKNGERVTVFDHKSDGGNTVWVQIERKGYGTEPTRKGWISSNLVTLDYHIADTSDMVSPTEHAKVIAERDAALAKVVELENELLRKDSEHVAFKQRIGNHLRKAMQHKDEHSSKLSDTMPPLLNMSNALDEAYTLLVGQKTNGEHA